MDVPSGAEDVVVDLPPNKSANLVYVVDCTPSSGMRVTLQDVGYTITSGSRFCRGGVRSAGILHGISGWFEAGEMTALMGPSGSGKTTLLDLMAGRRIGGVSEGSIRVAGIKPTPAFLKRYTGYVEQQDTLLHNLTVREMLMYTAQLKRSHREPLASKQAQVEALLGSLDLTGCADVRIGSQLHKGISGGQAKRTNIGIALITDPRVLFLDEPTSGLDSTAGAEVMAVVKRLSDRDVTVVATIHSPTATAFALFDRLMMLAHGRVIYFGRPGAPLMEHCAQQLAPLLGGGCSADAFARHQAEALVDVVTRADRLGKSGDMAHLWAASAAAAAARTQLEALVAEPPELSAQAAAELGVTRVTTTPWWWALWALTSFRTLRNLSDPLFLGPRLGDKIVIGMLLMLLYLGVGSDFSLGNLPSVSAMLFMWVALPAFAAASYMPSLVLERALFERERSDGLYTPFVYLTHKMVNELVLMAPVALVVAAAVFFGVRLVGSFWLFGLVYYATLAVGVSMAYFIAAIAPTMEAANSLLPVYCVTLLLFAGQLMAPSAIPVYFRWYHHIDVLSYAWGALMVNQFEGFNKKVLGGKTMLQYYSLEGADKWALLAWEVAFFAAFTLATWVTMSLKRYRK